MTAHISDDGLYREESVAEHTRKTMFLCSEKGKRCGLSQIMLLCGMVHDMGKEKQKFNDYIHADENTKRKQRGSIAHASTGAKYIYDMYHNNSIGNMKNIMVEMISYAVASHHGIFDCVDIEHTDIFSERMYAVEDYDEACDNAEEHYIREYELDEIFIKASEEFGMVWDKLKSLFANIKSLVLAKHEEDANEILYDSKFFLLACLQRLILSILIDSDWEATSDFMDNVDTLSKQFGFHTMEVWEKIKENFEAYMLNKKKSVMVAQLKEKEKRIFNARNLLQEECRQFADHPAGIYCLSIPTGGGKTLSSLAYALEYCGKHPEVERIIYVSPYISITEQNAQVFRDAVGNAQWVLEHHSSVIRNEEIESEDFRINRFLRYDINWEEPLICTTFVQFMNALFSDKSESIRRMHRLVNAVVIIDEVQSMPLKCIHTFNYMINFLNAVCNTNIILCTATQPTLEESKYPICYSTPKYIIQNREIWFRLFERVKICTPTINKKYTLESLGNEITEQIKEHKSILVVLNTKSAVRRLYDLLKVHNIKVEYLTTNLCAEHRSDKIKLIKEVLEKKQETIVVVSTNLIEAGVDISFECVYRSMTGLDSLAQSAGRCNRNGEMEYGWIHLIMLEGEDIGNMEELQQNIRVSEEVLDQFNYSDKQDSLLTPKWMNWYYKEVYSKALDKMNFPIEKLDSNIIELLSRGFRLKEKNNFMNQAYKTVGQAYRVIDEYSFGVIVPYKKGKEIIESIQRATDEMEIRNYVRQAQRYTVNVRGNQLKDFKGMIQPISEKILGLYMVSSPGTYNINYGIVPEWEILIV